MYKKSHIITICISVIAVIAVILHGVTGDQGSLQQWEMALIGLCVLGGAGAIVMAEDNSIDRNNIIKIITISLIVSITAINITNQLAFSKTQQVKPTAIIDIDKEDVSESSQIIDATEVNQSCVCIKNNKTYTLKGSTLTKSGDSTEVSQSTGTGINAGLMVGEGKLSLSDVTIATNGLGAISLYASGKDSMIDTNRTTITTAGAYSQALHAGKESKIKASNLRVETRGDESPVLCSDTGNIEVDNGVLDTTGMNSPIVSARGDVSLDDVEASTKSALLLSLEKKGSVKITNSLLKSGGLEEANGVIEVKESGEEITELSVKNTEVTLKSTASLYDTLPMIHVENANTKITLDHTKLAYGSHKLLNVINSKVDMKVSSMSLEGSIISDRNSEITLTLKDASYQGTINGNITLDHSSWEVTDHCTVKKLSITGNDVKKIKSNGFTITYDQKANEWLKGKTVELTGGGKLVPGN